MKSELYEKMIQEKDLVTESPDKRAVRVFALLKERCPDLTQWDLLCFCAEYIGMQATTHQLLERGARDILGNLYSIHYLLDIPKGSDDVTIGGTENKLPELTLRDGTKADSN